MTTSSIGTQTEPEAALDFGSQISTDGFGFEMDTRFSNTQQSFPFYIPALEEEQPLKTPVVVTEEQVLPPVFQCSDIRYKNKPMNGYVVDADGSKRTYGDLNEKKTDLDSSPTKATESAAFLPKNARTDRDMNGQNVDGSNLVITTRLR